MPKGGKKGRKIGRNKRKRERRSKRGESQAQKPWTGLGAIEKRIRLEREAKFGSR